MIREVRLARRARRQLKWIPMHVAIKLQAWIDAVESEGLERVRRIPGFHDEPLRGSRRGQRFIRLSRSYRAIYVIKENGQAEFGSVEEVTKHEY